MSKKKDLRTAEEKASLRAAEDLNMLVNRLQFATDAGLTFKGDRDLYKIFGYKRKLLLKDYRSRYQRNSIAKRAVDAFPEETWRRGAELVEDPSPKVTTEFEKQWMELDKRLRVCSVFQRADILCGLGHYSVVLIGAPGDFDKELPKSSDQKQIAYLSAYSMDDAVPDTYEMDKKNPRFGLPVTYQLKRVFASGGNSTQTFSSSVHWTRIIHIVENPLDDNLRGFPRLESSWNLFDDLEKITGGGSEAYFLRANQGMQIDLDKDLRIDQTEIDALSAQAKAYKHGMERMLRTRGAKVTMLGSDVANISDPADAILTQIAGGLGMPKRILTGSEMGQLASGQDRSSWYARVTDRQMAWAGPCALQQLADRLIDYGYLSKPTKYSIVWPELRSLNEIERLDAAGKAADLNSKFNGEECVTVDEVRTKYLGWEPLAGLAPTEDDPSLLDPQDPAQA